MPQEQGSSNPSSRRSLALVALSLAGVLAAELVVVLNQDRGAANERPPEAGPTLPGTIGGAALGDDERVCNWSAWPMDWPTRCRRSAARNRCVAGIAVPLPAFATDQRRWAGRVAGPGGQ